MKISKEQFQKIVYWTHQSYLNKLTDRSRAEQKALDCLLRSYIKAISNGKIVANTSNSGLFVSSQENHSSYAAIYANMSPTYFFNHTETAKRDIDTFRLRNCSQLTAIANTYNEIFGTDHSYILDYQSSALPHFLAKGAETVFALTMIIFLATYGMSTPLLWGVVLAASLILTFCCDQHIRGYLPQSVLDFYRLLPLYLPMSIPVVGLLIAGPLPAVAAGVGYHATIKVIDDLIFYKNTFFSLPKHIDAEDRPNSYEYESNTNDSAEDLCTYRNVIK
ncbi:MAG: hypothetical protein CK424_00985 [Legionella sp.]|nr:MAG: hypothetical protein CK424_00985 [Legionella sp.]